MYDTNRFGLVMPYLLLLRLLLLLRGDLTEGEANIRPGN